MTATDTPRAPDDCIAGRHTDTALEVGSGGNFRRGRSERRAQQYVRRSSCERAGSIGCAARRRVIIRG